MQSLETENKNAKQEPETNVKQPTKLEDDLGVSAIFLAVGVIFHFFAFDTNTPSWDGFYQFLSYIAYAISFFGAAYGIDKHSKKEAFTDIGLGVAFGIIAYWIHVWVSILRSTSTVGTVIVELIFLTFVAFAVYGTVRGFTRILIHPRQETLAKTELTHTPKSTSRERIAKLAIAFISLLFGFIQALPIIIEYIKTLLQLH